MQTSHLSVELVESIQRLQRQEKPLAALIEQLNSVTLPGLVEYCCLRYNQPGKFPQLPKDLYRLPLIRALLEIRSELGLRSTGVPKATVKNLTTRPIEFLLVPSTDLDVDVEWGNFCQRFERAACEVGFSKDAAINMHSALFEMAENAQIHSCSPVSPLVGYEVGHGMAMFTVADVGRGVLASLRSVSQYASLTVDVEAIQLAMRNGVTSRSDGRGGFGFNSVFKALAEQWGQLRFRSGNGCITMDGTHLKADKCRRQFPLPIRGFQVSVCCHINDSVPLHLPF